jgi:methanol--5-hydroxybenzimidazolylcobamide Co-methyltransferase
MNSAVLNQGSTRTAFRTLAISSPDELVYGCAPSPVTAGRGLQIGAGTVVPEINFTLPPLEINESTWPEICKQYAEMIDGICTRAAALELPGLLAEFETLPPMTLRPEWGAEITSILAERLQRATDVHGIKTALRLTPNDTRDHIRPPLMRHGECWDGMCRLFDMAAGAGADLLAIESTGGKEICDEALMNADLPTLLFALGVLAPRDMAFLWDRIVQACRQGGIIPSGDTACGFANTAMVLAEQLMVPRGLVAYECGAVGPSKDCAYEGPYIKAITGAPISMEGRSAACAHLSSVGNISQAVCDCWSNESVQNVRLLSASAPVVSLEQLAYDCRLLNTVARSSDADRLKMRNWLVESDSALDPQAYVLRPDVVIRLAGEIVKYENPYQRTRAAAIATLDELRKAHASGDVKIPRNEIRWLDKFCKQAESLPETEEQICDQMRDQLKDAPYLPAEYGLA